MRKQNSKKQDYPKNYEKKLKETIQNLKSQLRNERKKNKRLQHDYEMMEKTLEDNVEKLQELTSQFTLQELLKLAKNKHKPVLEQKEDMRRETIERYKVMYGTKTTTEE